MTSLEEGSEDLGVEKVDIGIFFAQPNLNDLVQQQGIYKAELKTPELQQSRYLAVDAHLGIVRASLERTSLFQVLNSAGWRLGKPVSL